MSCDNPKCNCKNCNCESCSCDGSKDCVCGPSSTEFNAKKFKADADALAAEQAAAEAEQAQYEEAVAGGATPAEAADSL